MPSASPFRISLVVLAIAAVTACGGSRSGDRERNEASKSTVATKSTGAKSTAAENKGAERLSCVQIAPVLRDIHYVLARTQMLSDSAKQQLRALPPITHDVRQAAERLARIKAIGRLGPQIRGLERSLEILRAGLVGERDCASGGDCPESMADPGASFEE